MTKIKDFRTSEIGGHPGVQVLNSQEKRPRGKGPTVLTRSLLSSLQRRKGGWNKNNICPMKKTAEGSSTGANVASLREEKQIQSAP